MTRYAGFLRGINLGPSKKVPMPQLRELAEGLGWTDVATYINSGNLVFATTARPATCEKKLSVALTERFGFSVDVCVRSIADLAKILAANPYPEGEPSQVTVAFLTRSAPAGAEQRLAGVATDHEPFTLAGSEVYVHYADGIGTSRLAADFSKLVGVSATVRNVRTIEKVLALASRA